MEIKSINSSPDIIIPGSGKLKGYASVFNIRDVDGDVILPGAFGESQLQNDEIKLLLHHKVDRPIGRILLLKEDERGLYMECELDLQLRDGMEAYNLIKNKVINGLSIGFEILSSNKEGGTRYIDKLKLIEISIVSIPSNPEAKVFYIKSTCINTKIESIMYEMSDFKNKVLNTYKNSY